MSQKLTIWSGVASPPPQAPLRECSRADFAGNPDPGGPAGLPDTVEPDHRAFVARVAESFELVIPGATQSDPEFP